jgi:hypothetical protein
MLCAQISPVPLTPQASIFAQFYHPEIIAEDSSSAEKKDNDVASPKT